MTIYELQRCRRSIRKFIDKQIDYNLLEKFVDHARLTESVMNKQIIRYCIAHDKNIVDEIFKHISFAGFLKGAHSPAFSERPRAYILFLYKDKTTNNPRWDIGAASHAIQLMAQNEDLGTCWMGAIQRDKILDICDIKNYSLDSLLAIGYPAESPVVEKVINGDTKYYQDENKKLHVPKLDLDEVLIKLDD